MDIDFDGIINEEHDIEDKNVISYLENFIEEHEIDGINKLKITDLLSDLKNNLNNLE